jgi:hypothetical protein
MTELESIISATCITEVVQVEDLTENFSLDGKPFRLLLVPKTGSDVNIGDIMTVKGGLRYGGGGEFPVSVGSWSPLLFQFITSAAIDLEDMDLYVAPIKYYKE